MNERPTRSQRRRAAKQKRQQELQQQFQVHEPSVDPDVFARARNGMAQLDSYTAGLLAGAGGQANDVDMDFDAHWANKKAKTRKRTARIKGRVYELPGSMPAGVMFFAMRQDFANEGRQVGRMEALELTKEMLELALTPAAVEQMLKDGIEMDELPDVLSYVMGNFDELGRLREATRDRNAEDDPGESRAGRRPGVSGR